MTVIKVEQSKVVIVIAIVNLINNSYIIMVFAIIIDIKNIIDFSYTNFLNWLIVPTNFANYCNIIVIVIIIMDCYLN